MKNKPNQDIREAIKGSGICSWEVAEKLNIHENSLYRLLRKKLSDNERTHITNALKELKKEREIEEGN